MSDFEEIIKKEKERQRKERWEGTMLDYLKLVYQNPKIAANAAGRVYEMIISKGYEKIQGSETKFIEAQRRYNFFSDSLFGIEESVDKIVRFLKAGSAGSETGKRILLLMGPPSSGKSTMLTLIKRGLEQYSEEVPLYAIKGCPMYEDPLHLIPRKMRAEWSKRLGIGMIEGDLCPVCRFRLKSEFRDESGVVNWEQVPVERIYLSERARVGIGKFQPSDPKSQDVSELIGSIDLSKITIYGEGDPRAYNLNGELEIGNRGIVEFVEMLKTDIKLLYILITVAQEKVIKAPNFPEIFVDTVVIAHTNQTEFEKFKAEKANEALHDRIFLIEVPYPLRVDDEEKVYKKLIRESGFSGIHIAPHTLKVAAMFGILTRLAESELCPSKVKKMKIYNGDPEIEEKDSAKIDVRELREEGRKKGEGMNGISSRFITDAINSALAGAADESNCITPIDVLRELRSTFSHKIGFTQEERSQYEQCLREAAEEYKEIVKKEVNKAFIHAYEDQARTLFNNYLIHITAYVNEKKIKDPITKEEVPPDENLMRSIEEQVGVSEAGKDDYRKQILIFKASLPEGEKFSFDTYKPLREAIEKKLFSDIKNMVDLALSETALKDEDVKKRRNDVLEVLKEKGYCVHCAEELLKFAGRILRE